MIRNITIDGIRAHTLSDKSVRCPNALDHDRQTRYGVKASTGMWITYREDTNGDISHYRSGRVLGCIDYCAPIDDPRFPSPGIAGDMISVLALADNHQHAYVRWVKPEDVTEVSEHPPAKLLAWITGPLPNAERVHQLAHYGTLSESYIDNVQHHVHAWDHGVSPCAWDAGVRKDETA